MEPNRQLHYRAVRMLAATTILWAASFPLVKGLSIFFDQQLPGSSSWLYAGLIGVTRFGIAALVIAGLCLHTLKRLTRLEITQGIGLGLFGGGGILFQTDGLSYTSASTSAFLTQGFCVLVPLYVALRERVTPSWRIGAGVVMIMIGVAVLSNFDPATFRLGRGETETLIGAVFFAGQILWLERPVYRNNNVLHFSLVMFATMAVISSPLVVFNIGDWSSTLSLLYSPAVLSLMAALVVFCTLGAFVVMNKWQPFVSATEAAIIYGTEPLIASALALFLPGLFSRAFGFDYPNERLTSDLLVGGGFIVAANLLVQLRPLHGRPKKT